MARIRIVCKQPPQPESAQNIAGLKFWLLASLPECDVLIVDEDGTERSIDHVTSVRWEVKPGEPARAVIEVAGVEADIEGVLETATCREREPSS